MASFAGQVVLITGAANGIGREFARQLSAEGARVAGLDRDAEQLVKLREELPDRTVETAVADVTDLEAMRAATRELERRVGPIDLVIASAGIGLETSALTFDAAAIAAQVNVNLTGVANTFEAVLPGMLSRRSGHLAALSSLASYRGLPRMAGYCASKAGLNALLDAMRVELGPRGIAVTTLCPGWIRTDLTKSAPIRARMMEVDDAVRQMLPVLRNRRAFHAFPANGRWMLQLLRSLPLSVSDWLTMRYAGRQVKK